MLWASRTTIFPYTTLFRSTISTDVTLWTECSTCTASYRSGSILPGSRSEEHTSELQSRLQLVSRLLPEKKKSDISTRKKSCVFIRNEIMSEKHTVRLFMCL